MASWCVPFRSRPAQCKVLSEGYSWYFTGRAGRVQVQLRASDGSCMPGIEVGEIGPKLNPTSINIGYCRFTHVRIPKENLFSKNSSVSAAGVYTAAPPKLSKLSYISMMCGTPLSAAAHRSPG